jgi:hypothetical protein
MKKAFYIFLPVLAAVMLGLGFSNDKDEAPASSVDLTHSQVLFNQDLTGYYGFTENMPALLFADSNLVSHPGAGPGGANVSEITAPGTLFGFGSQANLFNWMGDDFTIPAGVTWKIDSIKFYSYQTGATSVSTITGSHVRVWRGRVDSVGATVVAGDTSTNRMQATYSTNILRNTTPPYNNQRIIMAVVDTCSVTLTGGYYWLEWSYRGSLASGPWAPPKTIVGQPATGNGKQRLGGVWGNALDGDNQQGLPFVIYGTVLTGVVNNNTGIPKAYGLNQNYPNPFNPSTKISFDMPTAGNVKISVFDMTGKEVATVLNQEVAAGSFTTDFNASSLATGVYFYKMTTNNFTATKKMILVK